MLLLKSKGKCAAFQIQFSEPIPLQKDWKNKKICVKRFPAKNFPPLFSWLLPGNTIHSPGLP